MKNILIPAIVQNDKTKKVLMLGYMNREALKKTQESGFVWFWSRTRKKLWKKGETSGNILKVKNIYKDCDNDAFLILVNPEGPTCHTGNCSCFFSKGELYESR